MKFSAVIAGIVLAQHVQAGGKAIPSEIDPRSRRLPISDACENSFFACVGNSQCEQCLDELDGTETDLFTLASDNTCQDVIGILADVDLCMGLTGTGSIDLFCEMFDDCEEEAIEDDDNGGDNESEY